MLIPKKDRNAILSYLFKEGVLVARKDPHGIHAEINVPNLFVTKLMLSLTSKGLVNASFCWSHHYWFLNNTGIEYLREYLGLPEDIVPATLKRKVQQRREGEGERPRGRFNKDAAPGEGEFKPTFEGRGRGRGGARGRGGRGGYYRGGDKPAEQTQTAAQ